MRSNEVFIRQLNPEERALRAKWHMILDERKRKADLALERVSEAEDVLRDLALAFNKGRGPLTMKEEGLFEPGKVPSEPGDAPKS